MSNKDLLFYSKFCDLSSRVLIFIMKKNLKKHVLFINTDEGKYKIPQFIKNVPSLLTVDKELYEGDDIIAFLQNKYNIQNEAEVQTFAWGTDCLMDSCATIGDDQDGNLTNSKYTSLEHSSMTPGFSTLNEAETNPKGGKFDSAVYESYVAARNRDEELIKKKINHVDRF